MSEVTSLLEEAEMLRAVAEMIRLKEAEIDRLKALLKALVAILNTGTPVTATFIDELRKAAD